ncbi:hypothetical protein M1N23_02520 [Dehalococcoidia bacterium]|nr:hypothetical protein [Dehalococcoidia bacterium]
MPRGHAAKREAKKPKKNVKKTTAPSAVFADQDVQVIGKRRKDKEQEEER